VFHLPVRVGFFFVCFFYRSQPRLQSEKDVADKRKRRCGTGRVRLEIVFFKLSFFFFVFVFSFGTFFLIDPTGWTETETGRPQRDG
jgi:hypothetical protein